ncbi:glycosyltransferase family 2 protein [Alphaproteobacteria bacterium KMM 3653]|uniref:Glycosyltransferase family 2 protein n=1 Tax=Harenicola maris TaxID=2841044 RepID=A0AAP2CQ30_9RHOB|nr:glycosyltransferase family 2 protein [Harenicola maris]
MHITALILAYNEEIHIEKCIRSLEGVAERVCVIDSFSTDRTVEIARSLGAEIFQNEWPGHAAQFQWGLDTVEVTSDWTLRIDADEYLDAGLRRALQELDPASGCNGYYLRRQIVFLGRPIRYGFFYPLRILRLWRSGQGRMEQRRMDEHIVLNEPKVAVLEGGDLIDENLNDLGWWIEKHNGYATLEALSRIEAEAGINAQELSLSGPAKRKRWLKTQVYGRLPTTLRAGFYFFYRYILGRGFLDGKAGFYFHFMQGFWYRTLVEAKIFEIQQEAAKAGMSDFEWLKSQGRL